MNIMKIVIEEFDIFIAAAHKKTWNAKNSNEDRISCSIVGINLLRLKQRIIDRVASPDLLLSPNTPDDGDDATKSADSDSTIGTKLTG